MRDCLGRSRPCRQRMLLFTACAICFTVDDCVNGFSGSTIGGGGYFSPQSKIKARGCLRLPLLHPLQYYEEKSQRRYQQSLVTRNQGNESNNEKDEPSTDDKDADAEQAQNQKNVLSRWKGKWQKFAEEQRRAPMTLQEFSDVEDKQLLQTDMLALVVVVLALGLTQAVEDPSFAANGGWAASIPLVPPTMGTTMSNLSEIGIAWVASALYNRAYQPVAVRSDDMAWKVSVAIWVDHCSVRIVLAILLAFCNHAPVDVFSLWTQLWLTLPITTIFRVAYGRLNSDRFL
jgi:hypothetical protein